MATVGNSDRAVSCAVEGGSADDKAKNTWPAVQVEIAGSATLNSARYSRRSRWVNDVHSPSNATMRVAGAAPNRKMAAKTNTLDTPTVAARLGTLIEKRPVAIVRRARMGRR